MNYDSTFQLHSTHFQATVIALLQPMKVCEHKFPFIQYIDLPPPPTYRHKLQWKSSDTISKFDCIYEYTSTHNVW